jgi:pyrroline-5-carboxylate reductase
MKVGELKVGFIGFGHMAQILCRAIDKSKQIPKSQMLFVQRDAHKMKRNEQEFHITSSGLANLVKSSDMLVLGVRPNQAEILLKQMEEIKLDERKLVVSLLAGVKLPFLERHFGHHAAVMRLMPNVASEIGEGMSLFCYGQKVSEDFRSLSNLLFSVLGPIVEVEEKVMDAATAVSGCGPAFVFRLIESMARFAEKEGVPYDKAILLSTQVFLGAAKMIGKGGNPDELVAKIAVPGGMTEAGLKEMATRQIESNLHAVLEAAMLRAAHLSKEIR